MLNQASLAQAIEIIRNNNKEDVSLSVLLKLLAPVLKETHISLEAKDLRSWLFSQGYLQYDNLPSKEGRAIGLTQCSFDIPGSEYVKKYLACSLAAQEFIVNNLNAICAPIEEAKEAAKAEKELKKAEEKARKDAEKAAKKEAAEVERQEAIKNALLFKADAFNPSEEAVSLSALIRNINEALELTDNHKLKLGDVKPVVIAQGLIELNAANHMEPTNKGEQAGITLLEGQDSDGNTFAYPVYDQNAQKIILACLVEARAR